MSATIKFVAPRPVIVGAPLDPSVSNYAIAVGYYDSSGTPTVKTGLSGQYTASVTEGQGYVAWSIRFVASAPIDIPANNTAFIYAYDPSNNQVLDYVEFVSSSNIQTDTRLVINAQSKVARCMYRTLSCTSGIYVDCDRYAIPLTPRYETRAISTGAHTFNIYKAYALVGTSSSSPGTVGSTVSCVLRCGTDVIYTLGSFQLTDTYGHTYYGCLHLLS